MDMGRIDTDTMYANVMKWSWKNSNADIYIDPETRKNGISFRNSLGRLADELIKEKDFVRAEEILDMSLDKMPMKEYGYFRLVIGHIESYYNIDRPEKARKIVEFLIQNFKEKITYYSGVNSYELTQNFSDLEGTLDLYKYIIATCVEFDTEEYSGKLKDEFMQSVTLLEEVLEE
jgi:hypothetical protein